MKSIWIGLHAIERYARRVEKRDPATLTVTDRIAIQRHLLMLYQHSKLLSDDECFALGIRSKGKPGQERRIGKFKKDGRTTHVVMVCGPDDAHASHAHKMITVIMIRSKHEFRQES